MRRQLNYSIIWHLGIHSVWPSCCQGSLKLTPHCPFYMHSTLKAQDLPFLPPSDYQILQFTKHHSIWFELTNPGLAWECQRIHLPMQETQSYGFDPWVGKIPWRRKWQPPPVFLPGKFHGLYSAALNIPANSENSAAATGEPGGLQSMDSNEVDMTK